MPDGMWLVSLAPVKKTPPAGAAAGQPGGRQRRGAQPSATAPDAGFNTIVIKGLIFADKATDKSIPQFRDRLRESPLFGPNTEILLWPQPVQNDFARSFTLEIEVKEEERSQ